MFSLVVLCTGLLAATPQGPSSNPAELETYREAQAHAGRSPDAHVKLALWCEAHGLQPERMKHLAIAVLTDPANATARGLMGLVAYRGRWQRPDAVAESVKADQALAASLAEYNSRRVGMPNTAEANWKLALWCEERGLKAESQAHLTTVVRLDPTREAAWKRLGCKRHNGRWVSETQIVAERVEMDRQKQADHLWKTRLEKWRGWLADKNKRNAAEQALAEVTDPRAVPMVWAVFATGQTDQQQTAVQLLGQIDGQAASRGLAILAVYSRSPEVRRVATETLQRRDSREFVGTLIGLVRKPMKSEVRPVGGPGSPGVLFVEGERFNVQRLYGPPPISNPIPPRLFDSSVPFAPYSPEVLYLANSGTSSNAVSTPGRSRGNNAVPLNVQAARRDLQIAQRIAEVQQATLVAQQQLVGDLAMVEATNANIREVDAMVLPVLNAVTGQDLGEDPDGWKTWWTDQQGYVYEAPTNKPTFTQVVAFPYVPDYAVARVHTACFKAGTAVRTLDGQRPIDSIRIGDQVLTQATKTGALSFEPVLRVFHNKPAATLRIVLGSETIVATGIHRFWKPGQGWVMARDLKPGDTVRMLGGTATVAAVETDAVQPVFNLEVARGRSFFVGHGGALVHDNSLVEPVHEPFDARPVLAAATPAG